MKRTPLLLATFAALAILPTTAFAAHFSAGYDGPWQWDEITMTTRTDGLSTYYKGTAFITGYSGSATELTIPSKIAWYHDITGPDVSTHFEYEVDVVMVGGLSNRSLVSVTIPDSVTSIGSYAFANCTSLESVTILGNVTNDYSYSVSPFSGCQNVETITLGNNMTKIGNSMFYGLSGVKTITIPDSVTSIGEYAFHSCSSLESVTIGNSVTNIGWSAFGGCSGLTSVTIPNSVTSIGGSAFQSCDRLQNVYLSSIESWCAVSIPEVNTATASPFYYASNLYLNGRLVTNLVIPDGVEGIQPYAFYNCDCLQSVHIPDSVTNISPNVFVKCDNIEDVQVPQSAMAQGLASVFSSSYQKLRCLRLGANVTSIRDDEFHDFNTLEEVMVADGNEGYCVAADGCLYNADMTTLVVCPRNATDVVIPNRVTLVYNHALDGCGALWAKWYGALSALAANGGGAQSGGGGGAAAEDPRYALGGAVADRAIATVTVDGDSSIDSFVLTDGKVFDTVLRVINASDSPSTLTLPSGYAYERLKGTAPLTIPALSTNLLTITRTADRVFFVAREELEPAQ